jgi:hypothetical protein
MQAMNQSGALKRRVTLNLNHQDKMATLPMEELHSFSPQKSSFTKRHQQKKSQLSFFASHNLEGSQTTTNLKALKQNLRKLD